MQGIRQLREKYETIKQSNQNTPKKCLTPTISAQHVKTSPGIQMTPPSNPRLKKVCNNCLNLSLVKQKQSRVQQERADDEKLYQLVKQQLDQENLYRDQLAEEKRRKFLTYHKINGDLINEHKQRVKTDQQQEQTDVANFFKQLEKEDQIQRYKQKEKKEQLQQYYLRDLKNQIAFKEEEKLQKKIQNNKSDSIESQYWTQLDNEQVHLQQAKIQQQRQLINYWKTSLNEKEKLKQQQDEISKLEQEQMKILLKSNEKIIKANETAKKQQLEQFKKEINMQIQTKEQKKQREQSLKQQEYFNLLLKKQSEEQIEKQKKLEKTIEKQSFIKDIELQLCYKQKVQILEKEQELNDKDKQFLLKENPIKLVNCDECKHNCPQKVITNIIQ